MRPATGGVVDRRAFLSASTDSFLTIPPSLLLQADQVIE
jgi:hypothetical protein